MFPPPSNEPLRERIPSRPSFQVDSHSCVGNRDETITALRTLTNEHGMRCRVREPDAPAVRANSMLRHTIFPGRTSSAKPCMDDGSDYQAEWQWPDNGAPLDSCATLDDEPEPTSSNLTEESSHFHVRESSADEMVAGRLSSRGFARHHNLVQPEAGPSTLKSLYVYTHNPRNLVIDSTRSDVPHIVITRPEPTWDEYFINAQNRVEYQWPSFLEVPGPQRGYTSATHHPSAASESLVPPPPTAVVNEEPMSTPRVRRRVPPTFSKAQFNEMIDYSVWDRQAYPVVMRSILRRLYLLSVSAAVDEALTWRADPSWTCAADPPFQWVDPAHAILPILRTYRGTTVIDSITPLKTPHIVLNEPPPQSFWTTYLNIPSDPQDARFGLQLTVPWPRVINEPYLNAPVDDDQTEVDELVEHYDASIDDGHVWPAASEDKTCDQAVVENFEVQEDHFVDAYFEMHTEAGEGEGEGESSDECDSRPDTPGPETPLNSPVELRFVAPEAKSSHGYGSVVSGWTSVTRRPRQLSI